ncbi:unnamed protein product [Phytophthora fragariaefolia]|uniref:Unnamed protein product n=1 Tax=Phytophthora fragariaefolia TaxID=1490495 RepID=A0A9W6XNC6_9STRA|nr:unnamed protein product [Phytophthora fragariaefolia]
MEPQVSPATQGDRSALPRVLDATLVVRVGKPLGRSRGGWCKEITFDLEEGYSVFREKCLVKFAEVAASPEATKKRIELHDNSDIYLKRANNDGQSKYVLLTDENFRATLEHRWRLLQPEVRRVLSVFRFQAFLCVRSAAQPPAQFHRAAAARIKRARVQRMAHEAANAVTFGPITAHHLDVVQARRPDSAPFEVPHDNTTAQALELDRQRERAMLLDAQRAQQAEQEVATVRMMFNGEWIPVKVDLATFAPFNRSAESQRVRCWYFFIVYPADTRSFGAAGRRSH